MNKKNRLSTNDTSKVELNQEVYVSYMGRIAKGKITKIYETSLTISIKSESGEHRLMQHFWYMSLDDAINDMINQVNSSFDTNYKLIEDIVEKSSDTNTSQFDISTFMSVKAN